jgi:hypothetical protein
MKKSLTLSLALIALTIFSVLTVAQRRGGIKEENASALNASALQVQVKTLTLACCECVGKVTTLDLSTGQSSPIDPFWQVNGGSAFTTPPYSGWATTLGPAKWIQAVASPTPAANVAVGIFKYTVRFEVPKCTIPSEVRIDGTFAADNGAKVTLDGSPVTSCPTPFCFKVPGQPLSFAGIGPGSHTLSFEVKNEGGPSGLIVNARLTRQCQR